MATATADFEQIYRRHARDVYRFALSVVRNPLEAEDVTQTTFLNAYRALERGDRPDRPRSWLLAIAHNAIRSRDRWRLRRPAEVPLDVAEYRLAARPDETPAVDDLLQALGSLPDAQREALARRELQGQTYPEIAEGLGVSVSAVESLIGRARRALRAQRERLAGIAVLRRLCEQGDGGLSGVTAKAAVVVAAATALAGGMAVEGHVAGPPRADGAPQFGQGAPRPAPASTPVDSVVVRTAQAAQAGAAPAPPSAPATTVPAATPPGTTVPAAVAAAGPAPPSASEPAPATGPVATQPVTGAATTAAASVTTTAAAAASSPTATVPATTVPAATVPAVTTPAVTTPVATAPAATTPAATVPAVTTPAVTTPAATVPTVTVPALPPPPAVPLP
jgi:RNA polymerase sigma factor (sigma-70 family)